LLWPAFFGLVILAWVLLWIMGQDMRGYAVMGPEFWLALCRAGAADVAPGALFAMWSVMAAAMMLPTFVPALRTFLALPAPAGRPAEAAAMVGGYLAVWLGAAAGLAAFQWALAGQGVLAPDGRSLSQALTAGLFLVAGAYQVTPLKAACLSHCRSPLATFLSAWRPGAGAAFALGLRMGRDCLGCCWALMLLSLVGGMSNLLLWMPLGLQGNSDLLDL
jgi:predicted metal-binding membrane protein